MGLKDCIDKLRIIRLANKEAEYTRLIFPENTQIREDSGGTLRRTLPNEVFVVKSASWIDMTIGETAEGKSFKALNPPQRIGKNVPGQNSYYKAGEPTGEFENIDGRK